MRLMFSVGFFLEENKEAINSTIVSNIIRFTDFLGAGITLALIFVFFIMRLTPVSFFSSWDIFFLSLSIFLPRSEESAYICILCVLKLRLLETLLLLLSGFKYRSYMGLKNWEKRGKFKGRSNLEILSFFDTCSSLRWPAWTRKPKEKEIHCDFCGAEQKTIET